MAANFKTYTYDLILDLINTLYYLTFPDQSIGHVETECIPETFSNTKLNFPLREVKGSWWRLIKNASKVMYWILFFSQQ